MEFGQKLQQMRKQRGMTQEELAAELYVSRTAVSKWESQRGYPSIESLKAIARIFSVTVDELLSGDELLELAQRENKEKQCNIRSLVFALLDISLLLILFLPIFAQRNGGTVAEVSLLELTLTLPALKWVYIAVVGLLIALGILALALQNCRKVFWTAFKTNSSVILNIIGVALFIASLQPYAAIYTFVMLIIKIMVLIKK